MKRLFEHFYAIVGQMAPSQILLGAIVIVGAIVGTIMIAGWAKSQYYAPLYTGLSSEDAGKIVERLKEMKIQYQIGDNGTSVSVPDSDVYETRMKLATAGLPSPQNIGYALLDQTNIGMTDFLQKVNYRRALEGELARTIMGLNEVAAARVHLVIPEDRLFKEDQHAPTASVVLKLQGSMPLSKRQLQGVGYLVASSVEGMTPDKVTIIDYDGNLLSGTQTSDEAAMLSANQFEMRKNVENYLEQKAQSLLGSVIGAGRAIVRVTAELNFEKSNTQIEQYDPDLVAIRSEQRTSQKGSQLEGTAAAQTATPAAPGTAETGATGTPAVGITPTNTSTDNSEDVITNYEVSKTIRNIIGEVGSIKRLTVAVMVDGIYKETKTPEGDVTKEYQARSQEELNRYASIIKNAVGYTDGRADQFEIVSVPFDNSMLETSRTELDKSDKFGQYFVYGKKIGTGLLFLLGFLYVKKKVKRVFSAIAKYAPPPPPRAPAVEPEIPAKPQKPRLIDTMKTQAKGKNDEIAKVIKTMMAEKRSSNMQTKFEDLTAVQKAAIALIAFGTEVSSEVLKGLTDSELEKLTVEIANMRDIPGEIEDRVIQECYDIFLAREYISQGGVDYARLLLERAVGSNRAVEILKRLESSLVRSGFNLLKGIDPKQLVNYIQNEHPQTISLILTQLTPQQAASVLTEFPPELQSEVALRVATMEKISPEVLRDIEHTLDLHFSGSAFRESKQSGGAKALADILNLTETSAEKHILQTLEADNPDLAAEIKNMMFVFEDLVLLDDRSIQRMLKEVETKDIAIALKAASDDVKNKIYANVSERVSIMIKEEIEFMGPMRLSDVEAAQQRIVETIRRLEEEGQIVVSGRGGKEDVVV